MYRIRLNYDVEQWAYYRRCAALQKYAPPDFQVDIGQWHPCVNRQQWPRNVCYDLILQLVPDHAGLRKELEARGEQSTIIVGGLNVGWGHHKERLRMCQTGADHIVVNNRDCWERLGRPEGMTWISNGVDREIFRVTRAIAERTPRVLWAGCNFHCTHTQIKGWDEVLMPLADKLGAAEIAYSFRRVKSEAPHECYSTQEMVDWYNTGTIYICTSSSEGTPNPALEAAACGCVVVSTPVGNMPELIRDGVNGRLVERSWEAVLEAVLDCQANYPRMATAMQAWIEGWDWKHRAAEYYALFRRLLA